MDGKLLEMTRNTAKHHVRRCRPPDPSSASCRSRHGERGVNPRTYGPCKNKSLFPRSGNEVGGSGTTATAKHPCDLLQTAIDAALPELLIGRCATRLAEWTTIVEEATKVLRPVSKNQEGPEVVIESEAARQRSEAAAVSLSQRQRPRGARALATAEALPHISRATIRYEVGLSMKLSERKLKLIDTCRALRSAATDTTPPGSLSLGEMMQAVLEAAGKDIDDDIEYDEDKDERAETRPRTTKAHTRDRWEGERTREPPFVGHMFFGSRVRSPSHP